MVIKKNLDRYLTRLLNLPLCSPRHKVGPSIFLIALPGGLLVSPSVNRLVTHLSRALARLFYSTEPALCV